MELTNYRELSGNTRDVSAGFQFEFSCARCNYRWRSPFKPYRMGQLSGWLTRLALLVSDVGKSGKLTGNFADAGARGAKEEALREAQATASQRFMQCESCHQFVCHDCFDSNRQSCNSCIQESARKQARQQMDMVRSAGQTCPNCQSATDGGRFCAECGFDLASTHKGCPGCGAMVARQARFCTDCGHGF